MRRLTLGSLRLYTDGYTVLNEGGLLSWEAPSPNMYTRGAGRAFVSGNWFPSTMASLALQVLVQGSSADDASTKLSRLYRELYSVRASFSHPTMAGEQSFNLTDATGTTSWMLQNCHLSSSVEVDRRDSGKTYIVSFTLTPLVPCWESTNVSIITLTGGSYVFTDVGDVPVGNFQIIWQMDNETRAPTLRDSYSASVTRVNLGTSDRQIYSGETGYLRYDADSYTCGWVSDVNAWDTSYLTASYGDTNYALSIPEQGSMLTPYAVDGRAGLLAQGCTNAYIRFRRTRAIV